MIEAVIFDMYETLVTLYNSPQYFGTQMAADAGITIEEFQAAWRPTEDGRTLGKITLEEAVEIALRKNACYSKEIHSLIVNKRVTSKEECFKYLHSEIIPMLSGLKKEGIKIGLISNCFSEEAAIIRKSELFPFFDVACMSYKLGLKKPDKDIYIHCMDEMGVMPKKCLYVGDGGSHELEAARELGLNVVQAVWYLKEGTLQPMGRKEDFVQIENPLSVVEYAKGIE